MNIRKLTVVLVISLLCFVSLFCAAQPGGGGDPGGGEPVPITGIEILVAIGGMLGIKRLMGSKKSKNI
jgi:hypothetical protein